MWYRKDNKSSISRWFLVFAIFANKNNYKVQSVCQLTCVWNLVYLFLQHRTVIFIYRVATQSVCDHKYYLHKALYTYFKKKNVSSIYSVHIETMSFQSFVIIFFRKIKINWKFFVLVLMFFEVSTFFGRAQVVAMKLM